jgi:SAM-dependent methyltransferase
MLSEWPHCLVLNNTPLNKERLVIIRTALLAGLFAGFCSTTALAQTTLGDEVFQPSLGQPGKDVVWIPTPDALVTRMLTATKVTPDDIVYDLGAGDGKIPIAAAKQFGAKATGIEFNPDMAELARRNVRRAGVDKQVNIITGDIFVEDFSRATVVTMYLLPDLNLKLRPTILKMKPGTRVTSHAFHMGDWEPDERFSVESRDGFLWYVPANVEGTWSFKEDLSGPWEATANFVQRYQKVGGTITVGGKTQPLLSPTLQGDVLSFSFVDGDNSLRTAKVMVTDRTFRGELMLHGRPTSIVGSRK